MISISKKQWLLILTAIAIVFLVNYAEIWHHFPYFEAIRYKNDSTCNYRWGKIFLESIKASLLLSALTWLLISVSRMKFIQQSPLILKYSIELLTSTFTGIFFTVISILFSEIWGDSLWCAMFSSGPPYSPHVIYWSTRVVFPIVSSSRKAWTWFNWLLPRRPNRHVQTRP